MGFDRKEEFFLPVSTKILENFLKAVSLLLLCNNSSLLEVSRNFLEPSSKK